MCIGAATSMTGRRAARSKQPIHFLGLMNFNERIIKRGAVIQAFYELPIVHSLLTMKNQIHNDQIEKFDSLITDLDHQLAALEEKYV